MNVSWAPPGQRFHEMTTFHFRISQRSHRLHRLHAAPPAPPIMIVRQLFGDPPFAYGPDFLWAGRPPFRSVNMASVRDATMGFLRCPVEGWRQRSTVAHAGAANPPRCSAPAAQLTGLELNGPCGLCAAHVRAAESRCCNRVSGGSDDGKGARGGAGRWRIPACLGSWCDGSVRGAVPNSRTSRWLRKSNGESSVGPDGV